MEINLFEEIEKAFKEKYKDWDGGDQFKGSGNRLQRLVEEMCWSRKDVLKDIGKSLQAVFPDSYNEMLICKNINVWTLCPHHFLPCNFKVYIGYIPTGKVLGLSKFARVAVTLGKMPIMQEQYTRELADILWEKLAPDGLGVYVIGKHGCMGCRGISQEISIVTSTLKGAFLDDQKTRGEFYAVCKE